MQQLDLLPHNRQPGTVFTSVMVSPLHPRPASISVQLVCFPPAAGGFVSFRPWLHPAAPALKPVFPADWAIYGVQFPWAGWTYDALVAELTEVLIEQRVAAPLVLCGVSLGALLAFGVARTLRSRGLAAPLGLAVLSMSAPQLYPNHRAPVPVGWTLDAWREKMLELGGTRREALHNPARLGQIVQRLQESQSIPASFRYVDEPPFAFPIASFSGEQDTVYPLEIQLAWQEQTSYSFHAHVYPQAGHLDWLAAAAVRCCFLADLVTTLSGWQEMTR